jgi:hypothetical protein
LWVRSLDSLEARALPGTEGVIYLPWWSPDSRSIGFISGAKLRKIDIAGGPPLALADVPSIVPGGAWSQTGLILIFPPTGPMLKVPDTGGTATPLRLLFDQRVTVTRGIGLGGDPGRAEWGMNRRFRLRFRAARRKNSTSSARQPSES